MSAGEMDLAAHTELSTELQRLWRRWTRLRDSDDRLRLIEHYLPVMRDVVRRIAEEHPALQGSADILRWGRLGLVEALTHFSQESGEGFEVHCARCVERSVLEDRIRFRRPSGRFISKRFGNQHKEITDGPCV